MTLSEIKSSVLNGETVCTGNTAYEVRHNDINGFYIICTINNYMIGLTWQDGKTLNSYGDFFISK